MLDVVRQRGLKALPTSPSDRYQDRAPIMRACGPFDQSLSLQTIHQSSHVGLCYAQPVADIGHSHFVACAIEKRQYVQARTRQTETVKPLVDQCVQRPKCADERQAGLLSKRIRVREPRTIDGGNTVRQAVVVRILDAQR